MSITPPFVKKFDFRGIYNKDINDKDAYYLGLALVKTFPLKKVILGWDTRESSRRLAFNFINALESKNVEICYLDECPIDYVTSASYVFDFDLSVMFTGSHNPWNWTGLLIHTKGGNSLQGKPVEEIINNYQGFINEEYEYKEVNLLNLKNFYTEIEKIYAKKIAEIIPVDEIAKLNILVDLGDGSGSRALKLLESLIPQIKVTRINDRNIYDEESSHTADPSNIENMKDLILGVQSGDYSCGFAFDSDADRVLAVDENGDYLNGSVLGSAIASSFIERRLSDRIFGYAVDCGPSLYNALVKLKGSGESISIEPLPIGRSIMRQMLRDGRIDLGVENVGHFYSKDFFMTDSGIFSLAVILLWISKNGKLSNIKTKYPDGFRGEIFSAATVSDEFVLAINEHFGDKKILKKIDVDGQRYEFLDGSLISSWYSIRKSGYEKITKYYFGSLKKEEFDFLKKTFETSLKEK